MFLALPFFSSCDDNTSIGLALEDGSVKVLYTDTATVGVSTVYLDSVMTSGTGTMLFGSYPDAMTGEVTANSYFYIDFSAIGFTDASATYDSAELILPYSGYSYGDTTASMTLQLQLLEEILEAKALPPYIGTEAPNSYFYASSGLYNASSFKTESQPLATYTFSPRPVGRDSIAIPLPAALGQQLTELKKNGSSLLNTPNYAPLLNGFRISGMGQKVILGGTASGVKIRLYYSSTSATTTAAIHDFPLITGSTQFNEIKGNFSQTAFQELKRGKSISSSLTNDISFTQSGTGIMVKLDFPNLASLKDEMKLNLINKAVLEIVPVTNTNRYPTLPPETIVLYQSSKTNVPAGQLLKDFSGSEYQSAIYAPDMEYDMMSKYQFQITDYLTQLLSGNIENNGLLLAAAPESFISTVNRLCVGGPAHASNKVRLRIFYTKSF
ncbi:DUF4270 family protein [Rufibacter roseus]|uniref:DUF4270 family protein n=2 Tax=Rufibacter roseus TaxID=1567108 RepID=A0ABW2DPY0_9BACT|nr:DUF4270 family protein [Rufibacter roseus]